MSGVDGRTFSAVSGKIINEWWLVTRKGRTNVC